MIICQQDEKETIALDWRLVMKKAPETDLNLIQISTSASDPEIYARRSETIV
jgi:hypothetical protein